MKVLIVEDEERISSFLKSGLQAQGFHVQLCDNGQDGYHLACTQSFDAIILDIMLPGRDGLSILKNLRKRKNPVPILLLTARSELDERLEGLNLGADDYLTKPFYVEEVIARLHALHRRSSGDKLCILQVADLVLDITTRKVKRGKREIELTPREFNLLEYLMRSPGRVYSRTQILEHVWGYDFDPSTNLVDVNIKRLRNKLGENDDVRLIETVRGVGYRLKSE